MSKLNNKQLERYGRQVILPEMGEAGQRELLKEYEIETLGQYQHRSRRQINQAREKGERI